MTAAGLEVAAPALLSTAGVLIAEGDSWFDYPFHDVIEELEDRHAYDVESVAHKGDPIEVMAYGGNPLEEFTRRIEKVIRRGITPKAILMSGCGNDVAGPEFGMLLNHARSAIAGLNRSVVDGVIGQRIRSAYITILSAVTQICLQKAGKVLPILIHGYDYPVPDGRGFLGGWALFPWLEPGFREKGFENLQRRIDIAHELIDRMKWSLRFHRLQAWDMCTTSTCDARCAQTRITRIGGRTNCIRPSADFMLWRSDSLQF